MDSESKELGLGVLFTAAVGTFAKDLDLVKEQLKKVVNDIEALNKTAADGADKIAKAQAKAATAAEKAAEAAKSAAGEVKAGAEAGAKAQEGLSSATGKATTAIKEHGRSLKEVREDMKGLAAHTTSQIQASKMSADVYDSLAKKLNSAKGETLQYKTALANAGVEAGTSTIRFNQLSSSLLSNEKYLLQTGSALKKLGGEFSTDKSIKEWLGGVDRLQLAHASLNGEMFRSGNVVLDAKTKYMDLQRGITSLKDQFGAASWSALEMDNRLGSQVKTMAQAKTELTNYSKTLEPFSVYMKKAETVIRDTAASMDTMGQSGTKWAAGVDKGSLATALMNKELTSANGVLLQAGKSFSETEKEVAKIERSFKKLGPETFSEIRSQLGSTITSTNDYKNALQTASDKATVARSSIDNLNKAHTELSKIVGLSGSAYERLSDSVAKGGISVDQAVAAGKKLVSNHLDAKAATEGYASQVTRLSAKYEELLKSTGSYGETARKAVVDMQAGSDSMYTTNERLKRLNSSFMESEKGIKAYNDAIKNLGTQSPATSAKLAQIADQIKNGSITHTEAAKKIEAHGSELRKLGTEANKVSGFWNNLTGKLVGGGAAANAATDYFSRLGQAIGSLAAWIPAALIIGGITEAITGAISSVKEFDQSLKSLQAISGGTEAEISLLGKEMLRISDITKYSASEIAKGAIYIAQAGFTAGESLQVISAAAKGAQGTLEPLTTAADLLTTVLRAFHIDANQSAQVMDMLAMAANKSKTDLEGMKVVFNYLGPAAYSAGLGLNDTLGTLMALSNVGMRMSTVGTSLRQVFIGLENPSAKLKKALAEAGLTTDALNVKSRGLIPVLETLNTLIGGNLTNAVQFFNVRAGNAALVISQMNAHVGMMIEFTKQYGASAAMAGIQSEGMSVKLSMLSNQFQNFIIRMSEGGLTDVFKLVLSSVSKLISTIEYLVNNPLANFIITTGIMYAALATLHGIVLKIAAAFTTWAVSGMLPVVTEFMKVNGIISTMQIAFSGLGTKIITVTTNIIQATINFISFASRIEAATGALAVFTVAWNTLSKSFSASPIGLVLTALALLAAAIYTVATSSEKQSKALQENTITYANNAQRAGEYAAKLRTLATDSGEAAKGSESHIAVLKQIRETFPEVTAELVKNKDSLEGQAEALDKVEEKFRKLNESAAKAALADIARQYQVAGLEARAFSEAVEKQRSQLVQWGMGVGGAINWLVNIVPALMGSKTAANEVTYAWVQMQLAWNTTSAQAVTEAASKSEAALNKQRDLYPQVASIIINSTANIRQSLIDLVPEGDMKKMALGVVATFDAMVASMKVGVSEIKAKEIDAVGIMGGTWFEYYKRQDELGQASVAAYAIHAKKKIEAEIAAMKKGGASGEELRNKEMMLVIEYFQKMVDERTKSVDALLKVEDKLYEQQHAKRKAALEVQLGQLDVQQKLEIAQLSLKGLKEAEYLTQKETIEREYFDRNKILIADATQAELRALDSVYQAKLKSLELNKNAYSEDQYLAKVAAVESENAIKVVAIYKEQLTALKTHIGEKLSEFNKYKTEYDKTLKEIEKAEADHVKEVARINEAFRKDELRLEKQFRAEMARSALSESKAIEDIEKAKRDALQLTMTAQEKAADKRREVEETINKASQALREADLKGDKEQAQGKIDAAKDYYKEALGMINGIVVQNKASDGQLVTDDRATQQVRLQLLDELKRATEGLYATEREAIKIRHQAEVEEATAQKDKLLEISRLKKEALVKDLEAVAAAAKTNMENINTELSNLMTAYNELVKLVADGIKIKADTTQTYAELQKLTEHIKAGQEKGDYKVVLDFMGKASPESAISETIKEVKGYFTDLINFLSELIAKFTVVFLGDATGEGSATLSSTITWVDERMTKLYNKINGMRAVFTIVTRYVTEGSAPDTSGSSSSSSSGDSGEEFAEGGPVPGSGDSDSVPAMLTPGEFVISKPAVRSVGEGFLNFVNRLKSFTVPKFAMGGVVPQMTARNSSEEVFTLNLRAGDSQIPLKVVGDRNTMRTNIRKFEKELSRMRLSHA